MKTINSPEKSLHFAKFGTK